VPPVGRNQATDSGAVAHYAAARGAAA
jgi:hypothetical protein